MQNSEKTQALVHLAGTVAHELNNIFTAVTGNLSLLESSLDGHDANAQVVSDVIRTARRGIELSSKLQAFAGRQSIHRERIDLNLVVSGLMDELKSSLLQSIDVELDLVQGLCMVLVDAEKLRNVLLELAKNAVAAMNSQGWLTIATTTAALKPGEQAGLAAGHYAKLIMRDSGCGMAPQIANLALDPFFSTRSTGADSGWGLSKAAGFARQSGGLIQLSSQPGLGTTVELYLPQAA